MKYPILQRFLILGCLFTFFNSVEAQEKMKTCKILAI